VGIVYSSALKLLDFSQLQIHAGDHENAYPKSISPDCILVVGTLAFVA